jgi:hypothetical protein
LVGTAFFYRKKASENFNRQTFISKHKYKVSEQHLQLRISFLAEPTQLRVYGPWNNDDCREQVWTLITPKLDASPRATNRVQETEASLWPCPRWRKRRRGAALVDLRYDGCNQGLQFENANLDFSDLEKLSFVAPLTTHGTELGGFEIC